MFFLQYNILYLLCRLGVANSHLLHCYMSLDPRVPQLVFIVRAWAKAKGLRQLSNYALTLMVLYFLQTRSPPVIPSLQQGFNTWTKDQSDLNSTDDDGFDKSGSVQLESELVDNWDCSFFKVISRLSPSQNSKSLSEYCIILFFSSEILVNKQNWFEPNLSMIVFLVKYYMYFALMFYTCMLLCSLFCDKNCLSSWVITSNEAQQSEK